MLFWFLTWMEANFHALSPVNNQKHWCVWSPLIRSHLFWTRTCCSVVKAGWAQQELESEQTWPSGEASTHRCWRADVDLLISWLSSGQGHLDRLASSIDFSEPWSWSHTVLSRDALAAFCMYFACIYIYLLPGWILFDSWKAALDSKISHIPFWPLAFIVQSVLALYLIQSQNKTPYMPLQFVGGQANQSGLYRDISSVNK